MAYFEAMNVHNKAYQSLWISPEGHFIQIIDQRFLPHKWVIGDLKTVDDVVFAIKEMQVRGAPLIGVTAAWGMYLASLVSVIDWKNHLQIEAGRLKESRPTAVNLQWAVDKQLQLALTCETHEHVQKALWKNAELMTQEDILACENIGKNGVQLIQELWKKNPQRPVQILTHCNAGWLACVDWGTATAPMYKAHQMGIPIHVWVDETRPRNQGAKLTAWELGSHGISHTLIADNTGGHLMQHGMVDLVITGADRVTRTGDAANKIGTYLKALAAFDNQIPFYIAIPTSTIDWSLSDGVKEIPIETRSQDEVRKMDGLTSQGELEEILICPATTTAINYGFDVTPARLITGLITENGIVKANAESMLTLQKANS